MLNLKTIFTFVLTFGMCANVLFSQDEKLTKEDFFRAAKDGNLKVVKAAIEQGIPVDAKARYDATALSFACDRGHTEVVKYLIEKGADVNAKDTFYSSTPMDWAVFGGHTKVIEALVGKANKRGVNQALSVAIRSKNKELAEVIYKSGKLSKSEIERSKKRMSADPKGDFTKQFKELGNIKWSETPKPADSKLTKKLVGKYRAIAGMEVEVALDGQQLNVKMKGEKDVRIGFKEGTEFFAGDQCTVKFILRDDVLRLMQWTYGDTTTNFRPVKPAVASTKPKPTPTEPAKKSEFAKSSEESLAADRAISSVNWPQFRGNGARGVGEGQKPPTKFDAEKDENLLWKTRIPGLANSSPAIWGNLLFVTTAISEKDQAGLKTGQYGDVKPVKDDSEHQFKLYCLNKKTGKILWERLANTAVPKVKRHSKSTHANPTPATNGEYVVAFFSSEGLYCYKIDGTLAWKKDLGFLDSGWFYDPDYQWGFGASPIIYKDKVIVQCDIQKQSFLAAFDIKSGSEVWRIKRDEIPSWSTPTVVKTSKGDQLVTAANKAARAYNPENGKEIWSIEGFSEIVVPTPFVAHDLIFVCSGYRPIQPIYAIKASATGKIKLEKSEKSNDSIAWGKKRGGPYMPTPVCYGDYLYICSDGGVLTCLQAATGKVVYKRRVSTARSNSFVGSPIAADGHIYLPGEKGYVTVIKAGPEYKLVAENKVGESILSVPAISEGVLYVRAQNHVFAFGKKSTEVTDE